MPVHANISKQEATMHQQTSHMPKWFPSHIEYCSRSLSSSEESQYTVCTFKNVRTHLCTYLSDRQMCTDDAHTSVQETIIQLCMMAASNKVKCVAQ